MGYGSDSETRCTMSALSTSSSYPPGARASARSLPRTISDDSCVRFLSASKVSSGSALFTATHCRMPVPSRTCGKQIFPLRRRLYSHPAISTDSPACFPASAIVTRRTAVSGFIGRFQSFQSLKHLLNHVERVLHLRHFPEFQKQRIPIRLGTQRTHRRLPVDGASRGKE